MTNPFADIERFGSACDQEPSIENYDMYLSLIEEEYEDQYSDPNPRNRCFIFRIFKNFF